MAKLIQLKAHNYYWITAICILILGLFTLISSQDSFLDINIYDTYFVVAESHITFVLCSFYILLGLLYFIFHKADITLIPWLSGLHTLVSIGAFFIHKLLVVFVFSRGSMISGDSSMIQKSIIILTMSVCIAQILFIFNIVYSSIKYFRIRKKSTIQ
ncbi:hypothetical protein DFQ05_0679 [Winogradskyella wandonensis]|uniref:Cytochrome C and Quinol oxidase polypeptide I n=1 Tax=Winogradskyella wandonensis TaxID=1442586 RepID=A0A4R1KWY4_9FLAO|nr:hypothetical protein DFQ05_0679 [Winogradskyella wandonensis]